MCSTPDLKRPHHSVSPGTPESSMFDELSNLLDRKLDPIIQRLDNIEKSAFKEVKQEVSQLRSEIDQLKNDNKMLHERLISLESQSRRDNLRFDGIPEGTAETWTQSEAYVRKVIKDLGIDEEKINIVRAHRVGKSTGKQPRTILCKFHFFKDRENVMAKKHNLPRDLRITEDFPPEIDACRRILMPIYIAARKHENPTVDAKLRVDKLYINKQMFTIDNLHQLPHFLKPEAIFTKKVEGKIFFYTKHSPLSNHHPSPFQSRGRQYTCVEQFYMEAKAMEFGDTETAQAIAMANDAYQYKALGSQVKGYDGKTWRKKDQAVMKEGLLLKFQQNEVLKEKLLATKNMPLVEASPKDTFWGAGISIHDGKKLALPTFPGKNILGRLLMEVRDELR